MGSIHEEDGSFSIPLAYAMFYIWGTRMLHGSYSYEFAIYPFTGSWEETDIHRRALEYNFPTPVADTKPGNGKLGNKVVLFSLDAENILLSALYPSDGNIYVRFYEYKGQSINTTISLFIKDKKLTETDLDGNTIKTIDGKIKFYPWQIKTFRF